MNPRENYLRAVRFENPDYIPMQYCINPACWQVYPQQQLMELMEAHPFLFPGFKRPDLPYKPFFHPIARKGQPFQDDWGCVWETTMDGITGTVTKHPLESWDSFAGYRAPDPEKVMGIGPIDWEAEKREVEQARANGELVMRSLRHGHTFLQLCDIRGYENLLFDMEDEEERLPELIDMVEQFNLHLVRGYCKLGVDGIGYAEDLGMQMGPMLSPRQFQKYILPSYRRLIAPARQAGAVIHMHSDGMLHQLADDLLGVGVDVLNLLNLQDLVNGIDWIKQNIRRQMLHRAGHRPSVGHHIRNPGRDRPPDPPGGGNPGQPSGRIVHDLRAVSRHSDRKRRRRDGCNGEVCIPVYLSFGTGRNKDPRRKSSRSLERLLFWLRSGNVRRASQKWKTLRACDKIKAEASRRFVRCGCHCRSNAKYPAHELRRCREQGGKTG